MVEAKTKEETQISSLKSERKFWLLEIWEEDRSVFKILIAHPLIFSIPIFSLIGFDFLFKVSGLSEERKHILEELDFYGIATCLGILTLGFIVKLIILLGKGIKNGY